VGQGGGGRAGAGARQAKKIAMLGSFDHLTRRLIVHTSPTKRSSDFVAHLEQLDCAFRRSRPVNPA
jgi:hypothetical protein